MIAETANRIGPVDRRIDLLSLPLTYCMNVIHASSRALAIVTAMVVSLGGLLPTPHAHFGGTHSTVHAHAVADQVALHHNDDGDHHADHHDSTFDHGDHASALTLLQSYDVAVRFVLATATLEEVAPVNDRAASAVRNLARRTLLPTHDPPLRFTSSPAPPAVV